MKKVVFLLVILLAVTGAMFAQSQASILGAVPAAAYTKSDDNATWTFGATGISIRDANGSITIPIGDMRNLAAVSDGGAAGFAFAFDTEENKRTYRIIFNGMTGDVRLTIVKNGETLPVANLKKN